MSKLTPHGPKTIAELTDPAAIEWYRGRLFVAYDVFGNGTIGILHS